MAFYIKNTDGKRSASLTMAYAGFVVTTSWLLFWIVGNTFGLHVPAFDETIALSYLTPLLGLYYGRRASDSNLPKAEEGSQPAADPVTEQPAETPVSPAS